MTAERSLAKLAEANGQRAAPARLSFRGGSGILTEAPRAGGGKHGV